MNRRSEASAVGIPATSSRSLLAALDVEHPEWRPLLAVIEEAMRETQRPEWARFVPALAHSGREGRPLLDGAVINVAPRLVRRWVRQILTAAAAAGTEVKPLAKAVTTGWIDPLFLFETAVSQDVHRVDELARFGRDDRGVLRGLAPLIARPMLQACRRAWADRVPAGWAHGYCPICGGWPALAEIRGLDGSRHLRCGGCGGDWRVEWLRCPFCGEDDHEQLGSLMSPDSLERQTIEVCDGCRGYVKTVTTFTPVEPDHVVLQDLATLVLDVAALERDYRRPAAKGREVVVAVVAEPSRLRDLLGLRR
jgi:FdhE protein